MSRIMAFTAVFLVFSLSLLQCTPESGSSYDVMHANTVADFQLADNVVTGWVQSPFPSDLKITEGEGLYEIINGGATPYISCSYEQVLWQVLGYAVTPDSLDSDKYVNLMAMRYPTMELADSIFHLKTLPATPEDENVFTLQLDGYSPANAAGTPNIGGATYILQFGNIYFELTVGGFSSTGAAVPVVKKITDILVSRLR